MGDPYTSVSVTGYNANPPTDNGAATEANRVKWSTIKTKLPDPLKTAIEAINANTLAAFGKMVGGSGITSTGVSYVAQSSDQGKLVRATSSGITITTPDATSVGAPFVFGVLNSSNGDVAFDGSGSQTVNGAPGFTMKPGDGWLVYTDGSNWFVLGRKAGILPRGYIDGCATANFGGDTTNDINIAAGVCRDSTDTVDITVASMSGKQLDANWAPGALAGMRNSAAGITNTTYHIYAVAKADGTQDIYAHTSATVATVLTALQLEAGGADYVYARHIMSIMRDGGSIRAFKQVGDIVLWDTPIISSATNPGTSAVTTALFVPSGVVVEVIFAAAVVGAISTNYAFLVSSLDVADTAPGIGTGNWTVAAGTFAPLRAGSTGRCRTNTSAQVRARISFSDADTQTFIAAQGFHHPRGKDA